MVLGLLVLATACEPFGPGDTGGIPPSQGRLLISPSQLDFGTLAVLDATAGILSVQARNTGGSTLVVAGLDRVVGEDPVFGTNAPALLELLPDETLKVDVTFTPMTNGLFEGWLVPNGEEQVQLTGQAIAPVASLVPTSLDLGAHAIGCITQGELALTNTGDETLQVNSAEISSGFSLTTTTTQEIPPGEQLILHVQSAPITGGLYQGTVQVHTNDPFQAIVASEVEFLAFEGAGVTEEFVFTADSNGQMALPLAQQPVESTLRVESNNALLSAWSWDSGLNVVVVDGTLENLENGDPLTLQYLAAIDCSR